VSDEQRLCRQCAKPFPNEWCWENRTKDCWASMPPRWVTESAALRAVWDELQEQLSELRALKEIIYESGLMDS
jgi:hypothetical protein